MRKVLFVFLILLVLVFGSVWWLKQNADWILASYQEEIEEQLSASLGMEVSYERLTGRVFPALELVMLDVSLQDLERCRDAIDIEELSFEADLWQLLFGHISFDEIHGFGVDAHLESGEEGLLLQRVPDADCIPVKEPAPESVDQESSAEQEDTRLAINTVQLRDIDLWFRLPGGSIEVLDIDLSSSVDIQENALTLAPLNVKGLVNEVPFHVKTKRLSASLENRKLSIEEHLLKIGDESLRIDAQFENWIHPQNVSFSSDGFNFGKVQKILAPVFPRLIEGKTVLQLDCERESDGILVQGKFEVRNLTIPRSAFALTNLSLNELRATFGPGGFSNGSALIAVSELEIRDGAEEHKVESLAGRVEVTKGQQNQVHVQSELNINGYAFGDDLTKVSEVVGVLKNLKATHHADRGTEVTFELLGSNVRVEHPDVQLTEVSTLEAPLVISVPATGGYSVSGPVGFTGLKVNTLEQEFRELTGSIKMLVSGPLKRFTTAPLSGLMEDQPIRVDTTFSMTQEAYKISPESTISFDRGVVTTSGSLSRGEAGNFSIGLDMDDVPVASLIPLVGEKNSDDYQGIIKLFSGRVTGKTKNLSESLTGDGEVVFAQQLSRRFSLDSAVRRVLGQIPGFGSSESSFRGADRNFETSMKFLVGNETVKLSEVQSERSNYNFEADAKIDFSGKIDGTGRVMFLQDTFSSFGGGFRRLSSLLGSVGRVSLPLKIDGTVKDPGVNLDTVEFAKQYSGINFVQSTVGGVGRTVGRVGRGVVGAITSPFSSEENSDEREDDER